MIQKTKRAKSVVAFLSFALWSAWVCAEEPIQSIQMSELIVEAIGYVPEEILVKSTDYQKAYWELPNTIPDEQRRRVAREAVKKIAAQFQRLNVPKPPAAGEIIDVEVLPDRSPPSEPNDLQSKRIAGIIARNLFPVGILLLVGAHFFQKWRRRATKADVGLGSFGPSGESNANETTSALQQPQWAQLLTLLWNTFLLLLALGCLLAITK